MKLDFHTVKKYGGIDFFAKNAVEGFIIGLHKSPFQGFSAEFSEHKSYSTGESIKNIDWKLFARTDKLFKKVYEEETNLRCYIILDTSSSMNYPIGEDLNKLSYASYCVAALTSILQSQRDATSLVTFNEKIDLFTKNKSSSLHSNFIFENLRRIINEPTEKKKSNITETIHEVAQRIPKKSLVVILSDMLYSNSNNTDFFNSLLHLRHQGHETILFQLVDKKTEYNFDFDNKPVKFVDLETDHAIKLRPSEVKENIEKTLKERLLNFEILCKKNKTDLIEVDINKSFDQVLLPYLLKRRKK
jgi:uncharacterized protein (DUF58 family)